MICRKSPESARVIENTTVGEGILLTMPENGCFKKQWSDSSKKKETVVRKMLVCLAPG